MKVSFQRSKTETLHTLLHRSFSICCDSETFYFEIDCLKAILMRNNYPPNCIVSCIKWFINKLYTPKVLVQNVPKRNVFVKLPFLESTSFQIRKKLKKSFNDQLTSCKLEIIFTSPLRSRAFSLSEINYLRCYFPDLFSSISVLAAMLPIVVRLNSILKSEFVNI